MNPVMSSEINRMIHDTMLQEAEASRRFVRTPNAFRHGVAVLLVAIGDRLDPSVRRPITTAPVPRLRAA